MWRLNDLCNERMNSAGQSWGDQYEFHATTSIPCWLWFFRVECAAGKSFACCMLHFRMNSGWTLSHTVPQNDFTLCPCCAHQPMSLRFAFCGMVPREAWSVRRDDLGDLMAAPVPAAHVIRGRSHPADPGAGGPSLLRVFGAANRTTLLSAFTDAAAAGAVMLRLSSHPLVLLAVRPWLARRC